MHVDQFFKELLVSIGATITRANLLINPLYDAMRPHAGFQRLLAEPTASERSRP